MQGTPPFESSVHAPESKSPGPTTVHGADSLEDATPAERFRHSGWQRTRTLVRNSLMRTQQSVSRIVNWDNCGYGAYVLQSEADPSRFRIAGSNCHDRFCTPCAKLRSQCIANALHEAARDRVVRFVTLTLKHRTEPLATTLDRLYDSFAKLRRTKLWKKCVHGGAAFVEIKWIENSEQWHPHLHVICMGSFLPQPKLRAQWFSITGDSHIVDVRLVRDKVEMTRYVTKYVTKFLSNSFVNRPSLLDEAVSAMCARRLCLTFGSWRGILLTKDDSSFEWVNLGSLNDWVSRAVRGELEALQVLCYLDPDFLLAEQASYNARPPPASVTVRVTVDAQLKILFP